METCQPAAILETEPKDKDLLKIAELVGTNWEMLGPHLIAENPTTTVDHIKMNHSTAIMRIYHLLLKWRQQAGLDGTFRDLFHQMLKTSPFVTVEWSIIAKYLKITEKEIRACLLSDLVLSKVAAELGFEWTSVALELGLSKATLEQIQIDNQNEGAHKMILTALLKWRDISPASNQDKVSELLHALRNAHRIDLSEELATECLGVQRNTLGLDPPPLEGVISSELHSASVPEEIAYDPYKLYLYNKAIRKGKEKENILRINIVGNYDQGKTSLARSLIGQSSDDVTSTNGIEIRRYKCHKFQDGTIHLNNFEKEGQDITNRIASVALALKRANPTPKKRNEMLKDMLKTFLDEVLNEGRVSVTDNAKSIDDITNPAFSGNEASIESNATVEKRELQMSSLPRKEYELFSRVIENQGDAYDTFFDIWDFGGQYVFYATHTLFHCKNALYLLVFDLTSPLKKIVRDEDFPNETGERNMEYFAKFWLESIDAYTGPDTQVVLVGTHKDKLGNPDKEKDVYFDDIRSLFDSTNEGLLLSKHIQPQDFAVDNKNSPESGMKELIDFIMVKHKELVQIVEIPARWIQLEQALKEHQEKKIISFEDVINIDKTIKYPVHDTDQIKLFLSYHHDKGRLFYFDEGKLLDPIALDPEFLIEAFKCFITSEQFVKKSGARLEWLKLKNEGILTAKFIDIVWSRSDAFARHKDDLLKFLKNHNIIAPVLKFDKDERTWKEENMFIVPSLLRNDTQTNDAMQLFLKGKRQTLTRFVLKFCRQSVVHMVFNRIVAAALGIWPLVNFGDTPLLFENVIVLEIQEAGGKKSTDHAAVIEYRKESGTIELRLLSLIPQDIRMDLTDQLRRFVESFVSQEFRKLNCYHQATAKQYVRAYRCNHIDHRTDIGSRTIKEIEENENVRCPDNLTHEDGFYRTAKVEWFIEDLEDTVYPDMELTECEFSLLASAIGKNWELLGITLGLKQPAIDHVQLDHPISAVMQIYQMLCRWKNLSGNATLDVLVDKIRTLKGLTFDWDVIRNIRDQFLRNNSNVAPGFTVPLADKVAILGGNVTLECKLTSPREKVVWHKNGQVLLQDEHVKMMTNGRTQTLLLNDVNDSDNAIYSCVFYGAVTHCEVKVQEAGIVLKFTKPLEDVEVWYVPCTAEFTCAFNREVTEVDWYYQMKQIVPSEKYDIWSSGTVHRLKIRNVTEKDEGRYLVECEGKTSKAWLYVEDTEEERKLLLEHYRRTEGMSTPRRSISLLISDAQTESTKDDFEQEFKADTFYRRVIQRSYLRLVEDLDHDSVLDVFIETNYISHIEVRDIQEKRRHRDKTRAILDRVLTKGVNGYKQFKEMLIRTKQEYLVGYLENEEDLLKNEILLEQSTQRSANLTAKEQHPTTQHTVTSMESERRYDELAAKLAAIGDRLLEQKEGRHGHEGVNTKGPSAQHSGERKVEDVAKRLAAIGDTLTQTESTGYHESISGSGRKPSDLEAELIQELRRYGDRFEARTDSSSDILGADNLLSYNRFKGAVQLQLQSTSGWEQVALFFHLVKSAVGRIGQGTTVSSRIREYAVQYFSDMFSGFVTQRGGWDDLLEEESDSELD